MLQLWYNPFTRGSFRILASKFKEFSRTHSKFRKYVFRKYVSQTELSIHVWMLKDCNKDYKINWCIVARAPPYKSGSRRCSLCLTEESVIIRASPSGLLNKRTELISKCRHRYKYLLCDLPSSPPPSVVLGNVK